MKTLTHYFSGMLPSVESKKLMLESEYKSKRDR